MQVLLLEAVPRPVPAPVSHCEHVSQAGSGKFEQAGRCNAIAFTEASKTMGCIRRLPKEPAKVKFITSPDACICWQTAEGAHRDEV